MAAGSTPRCRCFKLMDPAGRAGWRWLCNARQAAHQQAAGIPRDRPKLLPQQGQARDAHTAGPGQGVTSLRRSPKVQEEATSHSSGAR